MKDEMMSVDKALALRLGYDKNFVNAFTEREFTDFVDGSDAERKRIFRRKDEAGHFDHITDEQLEGVKTQATANSAVVKFIMGVRDEKNADPDAPSGEILTTTEWQTADLIYRTMLAVGTPN
jgi:hypothetical protein